MIKKMIALSMILVLSASIVVAEAGDDQQQDSVSEDSPKLDVVFVIDTTGSMSDEIREVKMHIKNIIEEITSGEPRPDVCIGFVAYRDYEDEEREYLFKKFLLTSDIEDAIDFLDDLQANGGGDYKETVTVGLDIAINELNWRDIETDDGFVGYDDDQNPIYNSTSYRRMIFLIGDAPPRTKIYSDGQEEIVPMDYEENIKDAKEKGIYIYTVSASGMDNEGIDIWKEIADETNAEYEMLTYDRVVLEDYVKEHDLDEEWIEKGRSEGDYDAPSATICTNSLKAFVCDNVMRQAESIGVEYVKTDKKDLDETIDIEQPIKIDPFMFSLFPDFIKIRFLFMDPSFFFLEP